MANSTLAAIQTKVRRLTRSLSPAQLTDAQINEYINTFVQYDFPEHLRLFNLRTTFDFYTEPFVDVYETDTTNTASPLYDFKNKYITVHPPFYIGGYQVNFSESREKFFGLYPKISNIGSIGISGDGVTMQFRGIINTQQSNPTPGLVNFGTILLRNNVLFDSIDVNGNGLSMIDFPINGVEGNLYIPGGAPTSTTIPDPNNYINYVSGVFVVTFPIAPLQGATINSQTVPVSPAIPKAVLFYDGKFTVRPVPDQPYKVNMEAYIRPTELLAQGQSPELAEWWQYIAYGAAKKVFEDRMDLESVQQIMPEYQTQQALINRRTIVQQTSQRVATIYTEDNNQSTPFGPNGQSSF